MFRGCWGTLAVIGAYLLCSQHHTDADDDGEDGDGVGHGGGDGSCGGGGGGKYLSRFCSTTAKQVHVHETN